jgi:hypothetical protein
VSNWNKKMTREDWRWWCVIVAFVIFFGGLAKVLEAPPGLATLAGVSGAVAYWHLRIRERR